MLLKWFKKKNLNGAGNTAPMPLLVTNLFTTKDDAQPSVFHLAIVRLRANAITALNWNIYEETATGRVLVDQNENKIARSFWKPSESLTTTELLSNIVYFLDMYGNAFVRVRDVEEKYEFSFLPGTALQEFSRDNYIYQNELVPKSEVIHIRNPILSWEDARKAGTIGVSPTAVLKEQNQVLKSIFRFLLRFTERSGSPPVYMSGIALTPDQQRRIVQEWNVRYPDFPLQMFLDVGEIKTLPLSISLNVSELQNVVKLPMQMLSSFYGVPLGKITGENANYATAMINDYTFWTTSVKPTAMLISDAFTDFFRRFQDKILLAFEDVDFSVFETFKEPPENAVRIKHSEHEDLMLKWKALDRVGESIAKDYRKPFFEFWQDVKTHVKSKLGLKIMPTSGVLINADDIIRLAEMYFGEKLSSGAKKAIRTAMKELKIDVPSDLYDIIYSRVQAVSENRLKTWIQEWVKQINTIIETAPDGEKLQNLVDKYFEKMTETRPVLHARQLATITLNAGLTHTFEMFPEYDVVWLSQRDGRVRPAHVSADGQKRISGMFSVGNELLPFPGGGIKPENNIGCRCYVRAIRSTEDGQIE